MNCIRCNNESVMEHTNFAEMMKPIEERRHHYTCGKCGTKWEGSEVDPFTPETNGVAKKELRP